MATSGQTPWRLLAATLGSQSLKAPQPLMVALPATKVKLLTPNPSRVLRKLGLHATTRLAHVALEALSSFPAPHILLSGWFSVGSASGVGFHGPNGHVRVVGACVLVVLCPAHACLDVTHGQRQLWLGPERSLGEGLLHL